MENKLNQHSIQSFSRDYASRFLPTAYKNKSRLKGEDILKLNQHQQINYMIISHLFSEWQKERSKLYSPYFDFSAKEVQDGLDEFMNLLSRNISVEEKNLKPLLEAAVADTINLVFDPYEWLRNKIVSLPTEDLRKADLQAIRKYQKINTALIDKTIDRLGSMVWPKKEAVHNLEILWEELEGDLEDTLPHVKKISEVLPPNLDILYIESGAAGSVMPTYTFNNPKAELKKTEKQTPVSESITDTKTLNDILSSEKKGTLADHLQKARKVETLSKALSINQKFMFTNELFSANRESFNRAIDALDACKSFEDAEELISSKFVSEYRWDMDSEIVAEFLDMVAQRFGHLH